ncbi:MAG TPA: undecaprenyl-diphosphatase UppP [Pyrinomonadaceae bacterium]|nr:undecaprenyl-diphosphatase UppP [Pyrinomonadaceae bacterium]
MTILQAIILGIVQGLTEFIPVSSTAHLVFAARLVGLYNAVEPILKAEQTTATIAVIQLGTLIAVLVYFSGDIYNITRGFVQDHIAILTGKSRVDGSVRLSPEAWLGWLVIVGSLPVAIVGLAFKKQIEGTFTKNLWVIATMMIVVGLLLALAERVGKRERSMNELRLGDALAVGFAQVLALVPGSSRSGSTIMGGLFAGLNRETAARFSFLLSIPAIAASGLLELREAIHKLPEGTYLPLVVATIVSGLVGYASIWFLLRYLRKHSTAIFVAYRLIVGGAIMFALLGGYVTADAG